MASNCSKSLETTELHSILRLPPASDSAPAPRPSSCSSTRKPRPKAQTKALWSYNYCTNVHKTLRLAQEDLGNFVHCDKTRKHSDTSAASRSNICSSTRNSIPQGPCSKNWPWRPLGAALRMHDTRSEPARPRIFHDSLTIVL